VSVTHVVPINDALLHDCSRYCICGPTIRSPVPMADGDRTYTHRFFALRDTKPIYEERPDRYLRKDNR
jgi:hypothetical protein